MRAELHFIGLIIDLVYTDTEYMKQYSGHNNLPVLYNEGGCFTLNFPMEKHIQGFWNVCSPRTTISILTLGYPVDNGKIVFYNTDGTIL